MGTTARRFWAYIIDGIILTVILAILLSGLTNNLNITDNTLVAGFNNSMIRFGLLYKLKEGYAASILSITVIVIIIVTITTAITKVLIPYKNNGQTIGKMFTGCKVVDSNNNKPSLKSLVKRESIYFTAALLALLIVFSAKNGNIVKNLESGTLVYSEYTSAISRLKAINSINNVFQTLIALVIGVSVFVSTEVSVGIHDKLAGTSVIMTEEASRMHATKVQIRKEREERLKLTPQVRHESDNSIEK